MIPPRLLAPRYWLTWLAVGAARVYTLAGIVRYAMPYLNPGSLTDQEAQEVAAYINETALFRNQWGFRPEAGESDEGFKNRIRPQLRDSLAAAKTEGVLVPQVVYGYFPVNGDGQELIVWKDETRTAEWMRFGFPRQQEDPWLCIADFFRPVQSDESDYAAFSIL